MTSKSVGSILAAALGLVTLLSIAAPAWALRQRTFVSGGANGNDANAVFDCDLTHPCRTFDVAIQHTTAGGELLVLDTAGYGPMTIDRAIKVVGPPGVYVGISASSGDAVTVNAGGGDVVVLRGLTLNSLGAVNGIHVKSAGNVDIEGVQIAGFWGGGSGAGILVDDAAAGNRLSIVNVVVRNSGDGVRILADTNNHVFDADGLVVTDGNNGMVVQGKVDGTLRNGSFVSLPGGAGVRVTTNGANQHPTIVLERDRFQISSAGAVVIQNPVANTSIEVAIVDSAIKSSPYGVQMIQSGGGFTKLDVARTTFEDVQRAIDATTTGSGATNVMVVDSVISTAFARGISVDVGPGGYGQLTLTRTAIRNVQTGTNDAIAVYTHASPGGFADAALQNNILTNTNQGVVADSGSIIRLTGNVIVNSGPGPGLATLGSGAMESINNNMVRGTGGVDATPSIVGTK